MSISPQFVRYAGESLIYFSVMLSKICSATRKRNKVARTSHGRRLVKNTDTTFCGILQWWEEQPEVQELKLSMRLRKPTEEPNLELKCKRCTI